MQKLLLALFVVLTLAFNATAQSRSATKSYALIVGVSKYQDDKITSLKYAHKDAEKFAEQCTSPFGLNIPQDQVKLFTNENASYWNIVDGLDWLKSVAKRDDKVYIYFAGHGDMESKELKFGYLLAFDSRFMNYLGRSISLDLLNKTAHTLSVDKGAKVFLITDACHSGKLAGVDFNGTNLVALNLMQRVSNNEVRITSCNEGELSYEDEAWGSGRGAFSYFLNKGMAGEADGISGKKDGSITIGEIKAYINAKVPDEVKARKRAKQNPVIMGTETTELNQFQPQLASLIDHTSSAASIGSTPSPGSRGITQQNSTNVLYSDIHSTLKSYKYNKDFEFKTLAKADSKTIVRTLLDNLVREKNYKEKSLQTLENKQLLAKALYDNVQEVIDLYLIGDEAELEKRRYYSQVDAPYDDFPYMIDIAIKLLEPNHTLIPMLKVQKAYLSGLALRLKVPFSNQPDTLLKPAMNLQLQALALEQNAAYIHNELGILYLFQKDYENAKIHFERAIAIAPLWSLPYANMANLYVNTDDLALARKYTDITLERQPTLQNPYIIDGELYMKENNLLFAEEQLQHAIKLNSRHYLPFEKLGELFLKTQEYEKSDHNYYEAELRKQGLIFSETNMLAPYAGVASAVQPPCSIDSTTIAKKDIISTFALGRIFFLNRNFEAARRWFNKVVDIDVENPLVYHYLGQTAYYFKEYNKAEFYFDLAIEHHLSDSLFKQYVETLYETTNIMRIEETTFDLDGSPITTTEVIRGLFEISPCAIQMYSSANFDYYEPNIYLAATLDKWGNDVDAITVYNECIAIDPEKAKAYAMLWKLYQKRQELPSAEYTIMRFGNYFPKSLDEELASFYNWVIENNKEDLQLTEAYAYKYGLLMHRRASKTPNDHHKESLRPKPDKEEKDFEDEMVDGVIAMAADEELNTTLASDVRWSKAPEIKTPLKTGVNMLKKVVAISVDKHIKADAYSKMGDLYYMAGAINKALMNYENALRLKEDFGIRNRAITCADELFLFKKSLGHLETLKESKGLSIDDAMLLSNYYMRKGDSLEAYTLANTIMATHPYLKEDMEQDMITMALRFENYPTALTLLDELQDSTSYTSAYMMARSYAALGDEQKALSKITDAVTNGFKLGFVFKNDTLFDSFRSKENWSEIVNLMDKNISDRMIASKNDSK